MKGKRKFLPLFIVLSFLVSTGAAFEKNNRFQIEIRDILLKFPAHDAAEQDRLASEILELGPDGILSVCRMLVPPGKADDSRVRFALGGLTAHVSRPGMERECRMYTKALLKALEFFKDKDVQAFLFQQLQRTGKEESIRYLKKYLTVRRLCEPATQALLAIGSLDAEKALLRSLDSVAPENKVTVIKGLGELRSTRAVRKILAYASSEEREIRRVALFALANIGDSRAEDVLNRSYIVANPFERAQAPSLYLLYAQRLAEAGERARCVLICRELIQSYISPQESYISCAALSTIVDVLGEKAFSDLLEAMDSPHKDFRAKALELAPVLPGQKATADWVEKMEGAIPEVRAEIIGMLGSRGDISALPIIIRDLKSEEAVVRIAAIPAAVRLGGSAVLPELWPNLLSDLGEEIEAVKQALLSFPAAIVVPKAAELLADVPPKARVALIEILAERRAKEHVDSIFIEGESVDESVREAALSALEYLSREQDLPRLLEMLLKATENRDILLLQNAVIASSNLIGDPERRADLLLAVLEAAEGTKRNDILRVLPRIGGKKALQAVIDNTRSEDPRVQSVAVSSLSRWPDFDAVEPLRSIILNTENPTHRYVSLQGLVRLIDRAEMNASAKFSLLDQVSGAVLEPAEKKVILSGFSGIKSEDSLKQAVLFLDDPDLKSDAARAAARIALPEEGNELGLIGAEVEEALKKAAGIIADDNLQNQIQEYIGVLWKRDGFVPLFNGMDMTGWMGDTEGYQADEGRIVVYPDRGSGNLYTEKEYSDFILRFEFKLTPGANNGLGIRTPPQGDAAYVGMELQILDNTAEPYKDLKPYQYHGSIYGVVPAKREFLRPVGEWNEQEVVARGTRITVTLNGIVIVDADIDDAIQGGTMDGRDHPGLKNNKGHIGFLGHGSHVEFRYIWIKELK